MPLIRMPAVALCQGGKTLFFTSFTASDFALRIGERNFCRVDALDSDAESGYQRMLETRRARRLAAHMIKASGAGEAFLPTSILLATDKRIGYDDGAREIYFDPETVCPFDVVDGQHRIKGMQEAYAKKPALADFPLAVMIAAELPELEQMLQFYLVNTTQKSVDKSIEQEILARLKKMMNVTDRMPFLPDWIIRELGKDTDKALDIANYLNEELDSPWCGRIQMANQSSGPCTTIRQASFVRTVRTNILVRGHPLFEMNNEKRRNHMLKNYWRAVEEIFVAGPREASVVFRSAGASFFHLVSMEMFRWLGKDGKDYTVEKIKKCFSAAFDFLPDEQFGVTRPDWWKRGGEASGMNYTAVLRRAHAMMAAMQSAEQESRAGDDESI